MSTQDEKQNIPQAPVEEAMEQRNDALFKALDKSRKQKKRKIITTVLILILVAGIGLAITVSILRRNVQQKFGPSADDVLTHKVATGTISTVVSGSGILENVDTETVEVPAGVELLEILVENGQTVAEGQLLATADMATVRSAMSDLQKQLDDLDDQIADADGDKASARIAAGVPGRVKVLYGEAGDEVADVMVEHGALAVISLDGYMALDLETDSLAEGDFVTVVQENKKSIKGSVATVVDGIATILVTDDGPKNGESVTVKSGEAELGSGELYVHNPLMVTGYAGTIRTVHAKLNAKVTKNTRLFTLQNTEYSANFDTLLRERSESEEILLDLLNIQKHGGITAPMAGSLYAVADLDAAEAAETAITELATLSPDKEVSVTISVDESDILALNLGQKTNVTVSSVSEDTVIGIVTEIDKTASDGAYTAVVTLDKMEGMLPGMTADVDVKIQGVENAVLVPADALHYTSTGAFVYTAYDTETGEYGGRVDVVTGLSNDDFVEITDGLNIGDTVYYTESTSMFDLFSAMGMGGMGGMGGNNRNNRMPSGSGGGMPQGGMYSGGQMPGR